MAEIKTPADFIGEKASYDPDGTYIWGNKNGKLQMVADLRGWGAIQNLFKTNDEAMKFQDDLGAWIVQAINEKLRRERMSKSAHLIG